MTQIALTRGKSTTVDDEDYKELSKVKWHIFDNRGYGFYVAHSSTRAEDDGEQQTVLMHRAIWEYHHGSIPKGKQIDHINGNRLDNRLENLRLVTRHQNMFNACKKKYRADTPPSSEYKGVSWDKSRDRWVTRITGIKTFIGRFDSEEEAARAYDAVARERGEYARLNFPNEGD